MRVPAWRPVAPRRLGLPDLPVVAGVVGGLIGAVVLVGIATGLPALTTMLPSTVAMKANTALAFVMIGTALVILGSRTSIASRRWGVGLALLVGAIGGLTLIEYLAGRDLGIDRLLLGPAGSGAPSERMAPMTALNFLLLGLTTALAGLRVGRRLVMSAAAIAVFVAALNLFAFVFNAAPPSFLSAHVAMAAHSAIAFTLVGLGNIGLLGLSSPLVPLAGSSPTAVVSRRLLAVSVAAPVVLAWLRLQGQRLGLYDTEFGVSIVLVGTIAIIALAILSSARWASEADGRRVRAEAERDSFFDMSPDMLVVMGRDGVFQRVNRAWVSTFGYPAGQVCGRPWLDFIHPDDRERTIAAAERNLGQGEDAVNFANRYRCADGTYRWLEWMSNIGPDGSAAYAVARDVTARYEAEATRDRKTRVLEARNEDLSDQATRDTLTGLHNRRFFDAAVTRLERSWRRRPLARRPQVAVVVFDLDDFGLVNKRHGHQVGDHVLQAFGLILRNRFRASDLVVRYGGEEFVAVLADASAADALRIAESVRATLEATTIDTPSGPLRVTVSAGIAPVGDDYIVSAGVALADIWLSQAKRAGKNQVVGL